MVDVQRSRGAAGARKPLFWGLILGGLASLFVTVGIYDVVEARHWVGSTLPAQAVVEEAPRYTDPDDDHPLYEATVIFTTSGGEETSALIREECHFFSGEELETGRTVSIRYDPANPTSVGLASWSELWGDPTVFLGLGATCLAAAVVLLVAAGRALRGPRSPTPVSPPQQAWSNDHGLLDAPARRISVPRSRQGRP